MATLSTLDGETIADSGRIGSILAPLDVRLEYWAPSRDVGDLLDRPSLTDSEKDAVLTRHDTYFENLRSSDGYQSRDLIVLHPATPGLDGLLNAFLRIHTHDDDEVRYIVDGEGVFGFVLPDANQIELLVRAGDFIKIPKNTEHWFRLTPASRIKAVRYFTSTAGWVPVYTGTPLRFAGHPV
jgi:1,2-dihydroxy-3-keto-5-methylthiopentene dioxygenase